MQLIQPRLTEECVLLLGSARIGGDGNILGKTLRADAGRREQIGLQRGKGGERDGSEIAK